MQDATVYGTYEFVLTDSPAVGVRRITMNRPEKRNALSDRLRGELLQSLREGDSDDQVRVQIIRGAGTSFSAGYDLGAGRYAQGDLPFFTADGEGAWPRHVTDSWMSIWDLAKPVIAQVHGYCLAGGAELSAGCDLVYVAEDAVLGCPAVRFAVPDMHFYPWLIGMRKAMELMVTGDSISGVEAVTLGWANSAFPAEELDERVIAVAERIAMLPPDIVQLNKRAVHRGMEIMGLRTAIRAGTEICSLGLHQKSTRDFLGRLKSDGVTSALDTRDGVFGDYRTARQATGMKSDSEQSGRNAT